MKELRRIGLAVVTISALAMGVLSGGGSTATAKPEPLLTGPGFETALKDFIPGVNANLEEPLPPAIGGTAVKTLGAGSVRVLVRWTDIAKNGTGATDQLKPAIAAGAKIVLVLGYSNPDIVKNGGAFPATKAEREAFLKYATQAINQIGAKNLVAIEIWPGWDTYAGWGTPFKPARPGDKCPQAGDTAPGCPTLYAHLVTSLLDPAQEGLTGQSLRKVAPGVDVITAGGDESWSAAYLKFVFDHHVDIDGVSTRYTGDNPEQAVEDLANLFNLIKKNYHDSLPMWVTEAGLPRGASLTADQQARKLVELLTIIRETSVVSGLWWYELQDSAAPNYGLLKPSGEWQPAGPAFYATTHFMDGCRSASQLADLRTYTLSCRDGSGGMTGMREIVFDAPADQIASAVAQGAVATDLLGQVPDIVKGSVAALAGRPVGLYVPGIGALKGGVTFSGAQLRTGLNPAFTSGGGTVPPDDGSGNGSGTGGDNGSGDNGSGGTTPLIINQGSAIGKTYGDTAFTLTASGGASTAPVAWSSSDEALVSVEPGTGLVTIHGATGNAPVTVTATKGPDKTTAGITVAKAELTVTADNKVRAYGEANPALTVSYSGFVNGDTEASLSTAPTVSTTATETTPAGTVDITVGGGVSDNYSFTYRNGTLTITGGPSNPDPGKPDPGNPDPTKPDPGNPTNPINPDPDNPDPDNPTKPVPPTRPPLAIVATHTDRMYGDRPFTLTTSGGTGAPVTWSSSSPDLVSIDADTGVATILAATGGAPVTIAATQGDDRATTPITVAKKPLTVTADDQSRPVRTPNPPLTLSYSGFVNGDTPDSLDQEPVAVTTANLTTPAITVPITVSGGSDSDYTLVRKSGSLTITPAPAAPKDPPDPPVVTQPDPPKNPVNPPAKPAGSGYQAPTGGAALSSSWVWLLGVGLVAAGGIVTAVIVRRRRLSKQAGQV